VRRSPLAGLRGCWFGVSARPTATEASSPLGEARSMTGKVPHATCEAPHAYAEALHACAEVPYVAAEARSAQCEVRMHQRSAIGACRRRIRGGENAIRSHRSSSHRRPRTSATAGGASVTLRLPSDRTRRMARHYQIAFAKVRDATCEVGNVKNSIKAARGTAKTRLLRLFTSTPTPFWCHN
jgi:hypothetical protein